MGHRSLIFLGPENASVQIYVPLYLPDVTVIVHVTGKAESLFPCSEASLHKYPTDVLLTLIL